MNKSRFFLNELNGVFQHKKPIWFMRQAGRFLKSYRNLRDKYDFLTMCTTPELATEITIQPLKELDVDAMILFSDILIPLKAVGASLNFKEGVAPYVEGIDIPTINNVKIHLDDIAFVEKTIKNIKSEIKNVPLLGFAGAPFTLGCYMFGSDGDFYKIRSFLYNNPAGFLSVMEGLTRLTIKYLNMQIDSGVDAVQLFDSWAGILPKDIYEHFIYPFNQKIAKSIKVPSIYYIKNSSHINDIVIKYDFNCLSVDWRQNLVDIYLKSKRCVQGNLDNTLLLTDREHIIKKAREILQSTINIPHIFNLGHGVIPQTDSDVVKSLVDFVHNFDYQ